MDTGPILSIVGSIGAIVIAAIVGVIVAQRTKPVELMAANAELTRWCRSPGGTRALCTVSG